MGRVFAPSIFFLYFMENPFLLRNAYMFGEMRSMQAITVVKNIIL